VIVLSNGRICGDVGFGGLGLLTNGLGSGGGSRSGSGPGVTRGRIRSDSVDDGGSLGDGSETSAKSQTIPWPHAQLALGGWTDLVLDREATRRRLRAESGGGSSNVSTNGSSNGSPPSDLKSGSRGSSTVSSTSSSESFSSSKSSFGSKLKRTIFNRLRGGSRVSDSESNSARRDCEASSSSVELHSIKRTGSESGSYASSSSEPRCTGLEAHFNPAFSSVGDDSLVFVRHMTGEISLDPRDLMHVPNATLAVIFNTKK